MNLYYLKVEKVEGTNIELAVEILDPNITSIKQSDSFYLEALAHLHHCLKTGRIRLAYIPGNIAKHQNLAIKDTNSTLWEELYQESRGCEVKLTESEFAKASKDFMWQGKDVSTSTLIKPDGTEVYFARFHPSREALERLTQKLVSSIEYIDAKTVRLDFKQGMLPTFLCAEMKWEF